MKWLNDCVNKPTRTDFASLVVMCIGDWCPPFFTNVGWLVCTILSTGARSYYSLLHRVFGVRWSYYDSIPGGLNDFIWCTPSPLGQVGLIIFGQILFLSLWHVWSVGIYLRFGVGNSRIKAFTLLLWPLKLCLRGGMVKTSWNYIPPRFTGIYHRFLAMGWTKLSGTSIVPAQWPLSNYSPRFLSMLLSKFDEVQAPKQKFMYIDVIRSYKCKSIWRCILIYTHVAMGWIVILFAYTAT